MAEVIVLKRRDRIDMDFIKCELGSGDIGFYCQSLIHIYKIFIEDPTTTSKPIWIGQLDLQKVNEKPRRIVWFTCEARLRASRLVFPDGGEYVFPFNGKK